MSSFLIRMEVGWELPQVHARSGSLHRSGPVARGISPVDMPITKWNGNAISSDGKPRLQHVCTERLNKINLRSESLV
jgi:hypothetical protein